MLLVTEGPPRDTFSPNFVFCPAVVLHKFLVIVDYVVLSKSAWLYQNLWSVWIEGDGGGIE